MPFAHLLALVAGPASAMFVGGRMRALAVTVLVTWAFAAAVLFWILGDPDDVITVIIFVYIYLPVISMPIAAIVATKMLGAERFEPLIAALLGALFGWIVGLAVGFAVAGPAVGSPVWSFLVIVALPATYAGCGAVVAARVGPRLVA